MFVLQVPNSTYKAPKEMQRIEETKKKNQQKTKVQILSANIIILLILASDISKMGCYISVIQKYKFKRTRLVTDIYSYFQDIHTF